MYVNENSASYKSKSDRVKELINITLHVLDNFGVPMDDSTRRLERMALAFLAVADVKSVDEFAKAKDQSNSAEHAPKTRDLIEYINKNFGENISSGSYDDIRRKDLKLLVLGDIVLRSSPESATNDSTRGYVLNPFYADLLRKFGNEDWEKLVREALSDIETIGEKLQAKRDIEKITVKISLNKLLEFSVGEHNELQKDIIEEFLPRYGYGAEVLYVGDTEDKYLFLEAEKLKTLSFFELSHDQLPDVVAYNAEKNWLYLIEAVHSSGPIDQARLISLQRLTENCTANIIFVTAFSTKAKFRSFAKDIAWETEVWIAENPDHLIHLTVINS
jgi:type II restriction enzyme